MSAANFTGPADAFSGPAAGFEYEQERLLIDDDGDGYSGILTATGAGFSSVAVPTWADSIEVEYLLYPNPAVMWLAYFLPNGANTNCTSRRLNTASAEIDANELLNLPLGGSVGATREAYFGRFFMNCAAGAEKHFFSRNVVQLSTGATEAHQMWAGVFDNIARLSTFNIVGATSGGGLANAFLSGSWYRMVGVQNKR